MKRKLKLTLQPHHSISQRARTIAIITIVICAVVVTTAALLLSESNKRISQTRLNHDADAVVSLFKQRMEVYGDVVYGARGVMLLSDSIDREAWDTYMDSQNFSERYPGVSTVIYAERVTGGEVGDLERRINSTKKANEATVRLVPQGSEAWHTFISLVAPTERYDVVGLDFMGMEMFKDAFTKASTTGVIVAPDPFRPDTNPTGDTDDRVSLMVAVYDATYRSTMTPAEKNQATRGYVIVSMRPDRIFNEGVTLLKYSKDIAITATNQEGRTVYSRGNAAEYPANQRLEQSVPVRVGGNDWTITFTAPVEYGLQAREKTAPYLVLVVGVVLMVVVTCLYLYLKGARVKVSKK